MFPVSQFWAIYDLIECDNLGGGIFLVQNPKQHVLELSMLSSLSLAVLQNVVQELQQSHHSYSYLPFVIFYGV